MNSAIVTDTDIGILRLKLFLAILEEQEDMIAVDIEKCKNQITNLLKTKQRARAMAALKKKKTLQSLMDKRMGSSQTILEVLTSIESAVGNKQIMEAYSLGMNTLKEVNKGVSVEKVADLMDNLKESLADQKEIDNAIAGSVTDVDESEIEDELNKLMMEDEAGKKTKESAVPIPAKEVNNMSQVGEKSLYELSKEEEKELSELMGDMQIDYSTMSVNTPQKVAKKVLLA